MPQTPFVQIQDNPGASVGAGLERGIGALVQGVQVGRENTRKDKLLQIEKDREKRLKQAAETAESRARAAELRAITAARRAKSEEERAAAKHLWQEAQEKRAAAKELRDIDKGEQDEARDAAQEKRNIAGEQRAVAGEKRDITGDAETTKLNESKLKELTQTRELNQNKLDAAFSAPVAKALAKMKEFTPIYQSMVQTKPELANSIMGPLVEAAYGITIDEWNNIKTDPQLAKTIGMMYDVNLEDLAEGEKPTYGAEEFVPLLVNAETTKQFTGPTARKLIDTMLETLLPETEVDIREKEVAGLEADLKKEFLSTPFDHPKFEELFQKVKPQAQLPSEKRKTTQQEKALDSELKFAEGIVNSVDDPSASIKIDGLTAESFEYKWALTQRQALLDVKASNPNAAISKLSRYIEKGEDFDDRARRSKVVEEQIARYPSLKQALEAIQKAARDAK